MSEIDNLESLSNADLRKQCIKHGLPNVPITDSSRHILIKKLRATLSGSPASQSKKTPRRETIHVSKVSEVTDSKTDAKAEPERRTPSRGASRRTIAGTPTIDAQKVIENVTTENLTAAPIGSRRRSTIDSQKTIDNPQTEGPTPAPIGSRRRSTFESQKANENQAIESTLAAPIGARRRSTQEIPLSQKEYKSSKNLNQIVIPESDEEDNYLVLAAEQTEHFTKAPITREVDVRSSTSQSSISLTKTGVVTTSYGKDFSKPSSQVPEFPIRKSLTEGLSHEIYKPQISANTGRYSLYSNLIQKNSGVSMESSNPLHSRYSTNTLSTGMYTSKPAPQYNEQSDENEEDKDYETPFLSSFARNLNRIKSDGVSLSKTSTSGFDYSSPRALHRTKHHEITGRRPAKDSVTESFRQLLIALDRKYNLRLYLVLATVFLVLAFLYVVIYQ
ncbi:otefin [Ceratitis capitata]|nr:otefin [Ceratitis capitata]